MVLAPNLVLCGSQRLVFCMALHEELINFLWRHFGSAKCASKRGWETSTSGKLCRITHSTAQHTMRTTTATTNKAALMANANLHGYSNCLPCIAVIVPKISRAFGFFTKQKIKPERKWKRQKQQTSFIPFICFSGGSFSSSQKPLQHQNNFHSHCLHEILNLMRALHNN